MCLIQTLVIEMVCCSIASWMATWSRTSILSNSSMQQTPLSANMSAPASITNSCDSSSLTTAAVRPAAEEALPEVYTARGLKSDTCWREREGWLFKCKCLKQLKDCKGGKSAINYLFKYSCGERRILKSGEEFWDGAVKIFNAKFLRKIAEV